MIDREQMENWKDDESVESLCRPISAKKMPQRLVSASAGSEAKALSDQRKAAQRGIASRRPRGRAGPA